MQNQWDCQTTEVSDPKCEVNNNEVRTKLRTALNFITQHDKALRAGYFFPKDMVENLIYVSKNGENKMKIIALKLLASFAFNKQIENISEDQGLIFLEEAAALGDEESKHGVNNFYAEFPELANRKEKFNMGT